jgi:PAS domain S-box-containing protein
MLPGYGNASKERRMTSDPGWLDWIAAQGEMGVRVREFDWASTSLGPITAWPAAMRGAVMLCVGSLIPMTLRLGEERLLVYNDAVLAVYGPERFREGLGRPDHEVWPETTPQLEAVLTPVIATGRPFFAADRAVYINRNVPGEECFFTFCYSAVVSDDGQVLGVLSTFVEATREVLAERRLSTIAQLQRQITDATTEPRLAQVTMDVLARNAADHPAASLYRAPQADRHTMRPLASFGDIDASRAAHLVTACLATGEAQHDVADSGPLHAFPVLDPERHVPTHVLVVAHHPARPWDAVLATYLGLLASSVGAALLTQAELRTERRRVARAEALDAAKSAFFAGVSHELRTPLSLIAAPVADVLERRPDLDADIRNDLALVQTNADRLTRLVDAMLDFTRMEAGRVVPNLQPANLPVLLGGLAASFAPAMERAGLQFTVDVPESGGPVLVDPDFLERIVLNLLSNALKFTPEGSVALRLVNGGGSYEIAVTDTGPGIDSDDQERVFARFERLTPPPGARATAGAGIGLAMVRQLTELLGGTVSLASAPGEGSTFTVRLPVEPALPTGVAGQSITPRRAPSFLAELESWSGTGADRAGAAAPHLLVVEDDVQLARFLADSLGDAYHIEVASDGEAALAAIRARRPDIILSDLAMPGMDGLELVATIRADPAVRDLPVVLLTARADEEATAVGLGEGADDYIAKPFAMSDLRARLAANLERARERMMDAAWRRAALASIQDGVVIFDSTGLVLELNQAFTELLGYSLEDGPIRPPYPWWPTEQEDPETLADILTAHAEATRGGSVSGEFRFYRKDRRPVWVWSAGAPVRNRESGHTAHVRTIRDITRQKAARERRVAAAQVSADFSTAEDLDTLLAVAEHGFELLFDGGSTVQLTLGKRQLLVSGGLVITPEDLPEQVQVGLGGEPSPDTTSLRPGILLVPRSSQSGCRAWVQFAQPRRIGPDEMIVADLLAQAFALAVDRVVEAQHAADREANLQQAIESHRLIGQAIGILVERHRIVPGAAFDRLKLASQNRNLKLREVARRVIESGQEPEDA